MSETSMGIVSRVACAVAAAVGCGGAEYVSLRLGL
jgi:hypothetical protein